MNPKRRWRRLAWAALPLLAVVPLLFFVSCKNGTVETPPAPGGDKGEPWFEEVTKDSGIAFTYDNGQNVAAVKLNGDPMLDEKGQPILDKEGHPIGHLAILESLGGGAGLIDYDGDGLLDIFLPGGGTYVGDNKRTIVGRPCKLYKNLGH